MKELQIEDLNLIERILVGDKQSEEKLYNKYHEVVSCYMKRRGVEPNNLEDFVSDIMIRIFGSLGKYSNKTSSFRSWVFTITKNYLIDKWRTVSFTSIPYDIWSQSVTSESSDYSSNFENYDTIDSIANQLSATDYTLLERKYIQGYSYAEIGKEFNLTSTTVCNRVNYIKTKLKKENSDLIYDYI